MISDILSQLVDDLDHYLNDPDWDDAYSGELREQILRLREDANDIRIEIDAEPNHTHEEAVACGSQNPRSKNRTILELLMSNETGVRHQFFNKKDLLQRGWRKTSIAQLLGEPDWTQPNPHYPGTSPMLCWRQDRVLEIEGTPAFVASKRKIRR